MTENRNHLLLSAAESGTLEDVVAALGKGADVDARDSAGRTPLMLAAGTAGRAAVVRAILDAHADIDAQDSSGRTAVMEAILGRDPETLQVLLERGPDLSIHGGLGESALIVAASSARQAVPPLLAAGADPNDPDTKGKSPLMWAVDPQFHPGSGSPEMVNELLDASADVNVQDYDGRSALMWAVTDQVSDMHAGVLKALLAGGAMVDLADHRGQTPLMLLVTAAADAFNLRLSRRLLDVLIEAGADVNAADMAGVTVLARAAGSQEVIDYLKAAGAAA